MLCRRVVTCVVIFAWFAWLGLGEAAPARTMNLGPVEAGQVVDLFGGRHSASTVAADRGAKLQDVELLLPSMSLPFRGGDIDTVLAFFHRLAASYQRTPDEVTAALAGATGHEVSAVYPARLVDVGSSFDLDRFSVEALRGRERRISHLPFVDVFGADFGIQLSLTSAPKGTIEYVNEAYGLTPSKPYRVDRASQQPISAFVQDGRLVGKEPMIPALIGNLLGFDGFRVTMSVSSSQGLDTHDLKTMGGLESSSVYTVGLWDLLTRVRGAPVGDADLLALELFAETTLCDVFTGGQGGISGLFGNMRTRYLTGAKDRHGRRFNPFGTVINDQPLTQEMMDRFAGNLMLVQPQFVLENGAAVPMRHSTLTNDFWTFALGSKFGYERLVQRNLAAAQRKIAALQRGDMQGYNDAVNDYVQNRIETTLYGQRAMVAALAGHRTAPQWIKPMAENARLHPTAANNALLLREHAAGTLKSHPLYTCGPHAELQREIAATGAGYFPVGAGGGAAIISVANERQREQATAILRNAGIPEFENGMSRAAVESSAATGGRQVVRYFLPRLGFARGGRQHSAGLTERFPFRRPSNPRGDYHEASGAFQVR